MPVAVTNTVEGYVSRGFEAVREAFADNFARRRELGGACCVYHRGEKVVDLWGGIRNKQSGEPWEQDTIGHDLEVVRISEFHQRLAGRNNAFAFAQTLEDHAVDRRQNSDE